MKHILSFAVCVVLAGTAVHAQTGGVLGIYADPGGTVCVMYDTAPGVVQYYVVHSLVPAAQASRFRAPVPDCMTGAVFLSDETRWPIKIGLVPDGTLVGYGGCVSSPILVMAINIFAQGLTGDCCPYPVLPDPSGVTGQPEAELCDGTWVPTSGLPAVINPTLTCWCEVPVTPMTWGKIKALFTD